MDKDNIIQKNKKKIQDRSKEGKKRNKWSVFNDIQVEEEKTGSSCRTMYTTIYNIFKNITIGIFSVYSNNNMLPSITPYHINSGYWAEFESLKVIFNNSFK